MGYSRAGFDVVGVDINPQPNFPFEFIQSDALEFLSDCCADGWQGKWFHDSFAAIHASPPCQNYSRALRHMSHDQPELIEPVRELLEQTNRPWVIENVPGSPLPTAPTLDGRYGLQLCGTQFQLRVGWHRLFESSEPLHPPSRACACNNDPVLNPFNERGRARIRQEFQEKELNDWPEVVWRRNRGTEWMSRYEAREAIPPAYTEFIGRQIYDYIRAAA